MIRWGCSCSNEKSGGDVRENMENIHRDFMVTQKVYKLGGAMATANFDIRVNGDCTQVEKPIRTLYAREKDMFCQVLC